jgi:predicted DNA-binding transcriptional regulator YafY
VIFVFKLERILAITLGEERFVLPADFDLRNYRGERLFIAGLATVEVKLRLRGAAARRLGPVFKHSRLERGGGLIVRFRDCPTGWLASWILRQGPEVQVISPPRLAAWVGDLARRVGEVHKSVSDVDATSVADEPTR